MSIWMNEWMNEYINFYSVQILSVPTQLAKDVVKTFFSREMLTSYDEL